jgi:hypothetical protein
MKKIPGGVLVVLAATHCLLATGAGSHATEPPAVQIKITIDDSAIRQLIDMKKARDVSDAHLEAWLDLPANKYLLRTGAREGNLTRSELKANAVAVIKGVATARNQPRNTMGCLLLEPDGTFDRMLDELHETMPVRIARIVERDTAFSPELADVEETVYLHLGGEWDAVSEGRAIFCNLRFWHDFHKPGWDGFNMVIAHETMHTIQNAAYGNPELQGTGDGAFLTALSKIQREGMARYVEYDTDPGPYDPDTHGFYSRAVAAERLRAFPADISLLSSLAAACFPKFDHGAFAETYMANISGAGRITISAMEWQRPSTKSWGGGS